MSIRLILPLFFLLSLAAGPTTRPVENLHDDFAPDTLLLSPDALHYSHIRRTPNQMVPIIDGKPLQPVDWIINSRVELSINAENSLFSVRSRNGSRFVYNQTPGPWWDSLEDSRFTPSGHSLVIGRSKNRAVLHHDGQLVGMFPNARLLGLSDHHFAFLTQEPSGKLRLHVNTLEYGPFNDIGEIQFAPNRWACRVSLDDSQFILDAGNPGKSYPAVSDPALSPDGQHLAYTASLPDQTLLVKDTLEIPLLPNPSKPAKPTLSPDASRSIVLLATNPQRQLFIDNAPAGSCTRLGDALFSPDGKRILYTTLQDGLWSVHLDDKSFPPHEGAIRDLRFSPDGQRVAWTRENAGKDQLFIDGQLAGTFDSLAPGVLNFSPNGKHLVALTGKPGQQQLLLNAQPVAAYTRIFLNSPVVISPKNVLQGFAMKDGLLFTLEFPLE